MTARFLRNHAPALASACLVLLVGLSVVPDSMQVRTGAGKHLEHFVAYFGASAVVSLAVGRRLPLIAFCLVVCAGLLEVAQHWADGRTPSNLDFAAGAAGALFGAAFIAGGRSLLRRN